MLETDSNIEEVASDLGYNGSIDDIEFDMYTLHVGQDLGTQFLGCDLAAYFEVGYINGDATGTLFGSTPLLDINADIDIEIVPITINLKAERMFFAGIKGYITAGIGYAFTSTDVQGLGSEDDGGFYAQATMGLAYDINEQWEIYGGARWLYLSDLDLGYGDAELDDNVGYEIGLRYSF
jgi:opacity protein-like surface antigen